MLRLQGASNFRDLGGYRTSVGRRVRWGRVFRADRLDALHASDWAQLAQRGIGTAIDLRAPHEVAADAPAVPGLRRIALPIDSVLGAQLRALRDAGTPVDAARMRVLMQQEYRRMVLDYAAVLGRLVRHVAEAGHAVVFHCAAGKDRTGIAAALLLGLLGVDRSTIEADYLLTNDLYRRPLDLQQQSHTNGLPADAREVMWTVHASHLRAAFDALDEAYGGLEPFAAGPMGIDAAVRRRLVDALLEGGAEHDAP